MSPTQEAAIKMALEALEQSETTVPYEGFGMARRDAERKHHAAITSLKAALTERQEPVAWGLFAKVGGKFVLQHPVRFLEIDVEDDRLRYARDTATEIRPLYTAPPQRSATV